MIRALDLFAGTGWGVACQQLGILEDGVDNWDDVVTTRQHARLPTPWRDILDLPPRIAGAYDILLASPPCQSFSVAGAGAGRAALDDVLSGIAALAQGFEPVRTTPDPRTWLVLEPLRFALAGHPMFIAWEQVPTIMPAWHACAQVLRAAGYDVWTGLLRTEQYGVPQTRKRSILLARRDGYPAVPPPVTHSRYHEHEPGRLDPGVKAWISMGEALGHHRSSSPVLGLRSNYGTNGVAANRGLRLDTQPAPTVTSKVNRNKWIDLGSGLVTGWVTVAQAKTLQTYPLRFAFTGSEPSQYQQIGNAVPPLFAAALLSTFLSPSQGETRPWHY